MVFKQISPFVIAITLIISIIFAMKVEKKEILETDGIFSIVGFGLGLIITFMNLIYSNNYLITLGPTLAIASVSYMRFRNKILTNEIFIINFNNRLLKVINILYWVSISIALISYQQASPYYRSPIFFVYVSFGVTLLCLAIISSRFKGNSNILIMIFNILLISLILRASAYFISQYPVGADPWGHADLINDIYRFGSLDVPKTLTSTYYANYPLMHIYTVAIDLIGNIDIKGSMFIIGIVLTISTLFVYLIVKNITDNINLALLSMLMINFADFHIEYSIETIAMSLGIAIYTILLYLIIKRNEKYMLSFLFIFLFIITWTHTISGFIALVSVISLYFGSLLHKLIYDKLDENQLVSFKLCVLFSVLLLFHWADLKYPFLGSITDGMTNSLSSEAKFLGRVTGSNVAEGWDNILNIFGFLIYIFFGIIGCLYCLRKNAVRTMVSLVFMLTVLYFIFFTFPLFGIRNIVPYRWPAFIYVSFVLFVGIGLMRISSILKSKQLRTAFILSILFISSFFMITNFVTDIDSPIYGKEINEKLIWSDSEMNMFKNINKSFGGIIVTDRQTAANPFRNYLKRQEAVDSYHSTIDGYIDWIYLDNKLVVWRKISLSRPVDILFLAKLDSSFSNIYDVGDARTYLKTLQ